MFKKYSKWYNSMTPLKQLTVSYILNWIFWLITALIVERIYYDERQSWGFQIFEASCMAFFTTIFFSWNTIKALFKSDKNKEQISDAE